MLWEWNPGALSPLGQSLAKGAISIIPLWEGYNAQVHADPNALYNPWDLIRQYRLNFAKTGTAGYPNYTDLAASNTATRVPAGIGLNLFQSGFSNSAHGLDYKAASPLNLPSGSDFTFTVAAVIEHMYSANAGYLRSGTGSTPVGNSFCIFESSQPRPWVRWNGNDVLRITSGTSFSLNEFVLLHYVVRSAENVEFWVNGVKTNSATHAVATPSIDWRYLGWQSSGDSVKSNVAMFQMHSRAKTQEEIEGEAFDPFAVFRREERTPVFAFGPQPTPSSFNPAWARPRSGIIGAGLR